MLQADNSLGETRFLTPSQAISFVMEALVAVGARFVGVALLILAVLVSAFLEVIQQWEFAVVFIRLQPDLDFFVGERETRSESVSDAAFYTQGLEAWKAGSTQALSALRSLEAQMEGWKHVRNVKPQEVQSLEIPG